ncbi:NAD(P)-dependent oxidoreductase [Streptomyces katsurahamanus]|uniref:NAD(P)-dependent oxidoreductase n=1 Tax=Streptomyces katsurahamanus TaxID=2577098 RepID=A0ABW9NNJ3_9ACTN|nr:NAD(P)-dependent oxidoreductase [Streptomyces katsurahamanus]MQS34798.1 NAD(P)-dependent oxidoreductase [Streptomyces katsurahamanus]
MTRLAVIGLGAMGGAVARRLATAGHEVLVWNRTPTAAARLARPGIVPVASPAEAARRADAVLVLVADDQALADVVQGPDGIAAGAAAHPAAVIQMSTVSHALSRRLADQLPAGAALLDAPVMGSPDAVEEGRATVFAGGTPQDVESWRPVLADVGQVLVTGPVGSATAAKLVANSSLFGTVALLGESVALGQALGLDPDTVFGVLAATPLAAQAERRRPSLEKDRYPPRFSLGLAAKDAELILDAARAQGVNLRIGSAVRAWIADAETRGYGAQDYTVLLRCATRPDGPGAVRRPPASMT